MKNTMNKVYLLLGGNLQDVEKTFENARYEIEQSIGSITNLSGEYQSKAWGFESENTFLNQVLEINTIQNPINTLSNIQDIETKLGRTRTKGLQGYESRVIDIDILYFNSEIHESEKLTIPHPSLHERRFTLAPLVEISPLYNHPVLNKSNQELLNSCKDTNTVILK